MSHFAAKERPGSTLLNRSAARLAVAIFVAAASACSDSTGGSPPDETAPTLRIDAPTDNSATAATTVTVSGVASDEEGVTRLSYQVNGGAETDVGITAGPSVPFSFSVTLAAGTNTVQLRAYDEAGNAGSASVGTLLDNTPPAVTLTGPGPSVTLIAPSVAVQGTATDTRGVTRLSYQVNGGTETDVAITAGTSVTFNTSIPLTVGANAVTLNAYDALGNRTQVQRAVERLAAGVALVSLRSASGAAVADAQITATLAAASGMVAPQPRGPAREVVFAPGAMYGIENLGNGNYGVHLPVGATASLQITHPSFLPLVYNNVAVQQAGSTQLEPVRLVPATNASPGAAQVHVSDAFNGAPLGQVTLRVRAGMNTTTGAAVATAVTDAGGNASFQEMAAGSYTVEMERTGYSGGFFTMTIVGGETATYPGSIAPVVAAGQIRIILDWGLTPSDLDSHLTGPTVDGTGRFHVFYSDDVYYDGEEAVAALDYDDTDSYGPETITIYTQDSGVYRYSVHDYSNRFETASTGLGTSGARVRVYRGADLVRTFHVPTGVAGTLWTVFELDGTTLTPVNQMSYQEDPDAVADRASAEGASRGTARVKRP